MSKPIRRILFLTNSDHGLVSVVIAVAHTLLQTTTDVEVHVASFCSLKTIAENIGRTAPSRLKFHQINGLSAMVAAFRPEVGVKEAHDLKPNFINSARNILALPAVVLPWTPDEFVDIHEEVAIIMKDVDPDLTVVDPLFAVGLTLCHHLGVKWLVLAPNTIKDFALPLQPHLAMLWKYPMLCSALPFPIPYSLIPYNIALCLHAGYVFATDHRLSQVSKAIQRINPAIKIMTANELGITKAAPPGVKVLVSSAPGLDYPFSVLPDHVISCGPIIRPSLKLSSLDAPLGDWLRQGATVYVNTGTLLKLDAEEALEMAKAFREVLDRAESETSGMRRLQILWKLSRQLSEHERSNKDDFAGEWKRVLDILRPELAADRIRIIDWLTVEPFSVLMSGDVICFVHHGGASSFNEAVCAGVPQVLLPPWADCYDFGNRAELLGIGKWCNKTAKPRWERYELAEGLTAVLFGPDSGAIRDRAQSLAREYPENAGREIAVKEILLAMDA